MKHAPTLAAIDAAELKLEESRRETLQALRRARLAFRESASRPSTIAAAAGVASVAGIAGFLLARRPRRQQRKRMAYAATAGAGVVVASSLAALARLLLSRYGIRGLTLVVRQARKSWAKRKARGYTQVPARATAA